MSCDHSRTRDKPRPRGRRSDFEPPDLEDANTATPAGAQE